MYIFLDVFSVLNVDFYFHLTVSPVHYEASGGFHM